MYFPSPDEQRYVQRALLPEARHQPVAEELRGWSWPQPPLRPVYAAPLGVYEVAGKYCPTGRDVFHRRVGGLAPPPNVGMREGRVFHQLVAGLFVEAKRLLYLHGSACLPHLERLAEQPMPDLGQVGPAPEQPESPADRMPVPPDGGAPMARTTREQQSLRDRLLALRGFQARRIVQRVEDALARHPRLGPDALAVLALPVHVEVALDGRFLGLSPRLSADAIAFPEMLVLDVKFGPREPFHRLTTTGYALVLESLFEAPVDLGCVVHARFQDGHVVVERDYHLIGDELRQTFVEERDEKMRLVSEELDPGLPAVCPRTCPFFGPCHPAQEVRSETAESTTSANLPRRRAARALAGP